MHSLRYEVVSTNAYEFIKDEFGIVIKNESTETWCYCAFYAESIIGFIYITCLSNQEYLLKYINVVPVFRNQGVGSELLENAVLFVKSKNGNLIKAVYNNTYDINIVNSFFRKNDWLPVSSNYLAYKIPLKKFNDSFERFFSSKDNHFEKHLKVLFYDELNEEQVRSVSLSSEIIIEDSMPFDHSKKLSKELSLFAFEKESIVGWNTMYYNELTLYVRETYVREDYRSLALGFYLWYKTLKKIITLDKYSSLKWFSFEFDRTNKRLLILYEKLFQGLINSRIEQWSVIKII